MEQRRQFSQGSKRALMACALALLVASVVSRWARDFEASKDKVNPLDPEEREALLKDENVVRPRRWLTARSPSLVSHLLQLVELYTYDYRCRVAADVPPLSDLVIVAIDRGSMDMMRQWKGLSASKVSFPRSVYAQLVRRLKKAGAKIVAFDLTFSDPLDTEGDQAFANAIRETGNVILSVAPNEVEEMGVRGSALAPLLPELEEAVNWRVGVTAVIRDPADDRVRRFRVLHEAELGNLPAFPALVAAYMRAGNIPPNVEASNKIMDELERELKAGRCKGLDGVDHAIPYVPYTETIERVRTDPKAGKKTILRLSLAYRKVAFFQFFGGARSYPHYSFFDAFQTWKDEAMQQRFKDKVVLVGATAEIIHDEFPTPFGTMPGVEVWANAIQAMLQGRYIQPVPSAVNYLSIYALALLSAILTLFFHRPVSACASWMEARLSFAVRGVRVGLYLPTWLLLYTSSGLLPPALGLYALAQYLFTKHHLNLLVTYPITAGILTYGAGVLLMFLTAEQDRKRAYDRFGKIVSPGVFHDILANPEDAPKPRRIRATLLFTDLQGFTTLSEGRDPAEVVEVLNAYFDRMVPIVFKHQGTIDKYIGDAIMAIFGAPIPYDDHPQRAVQAAIEMQEELVKFREEGRRRGWPDLFMRIGLHTDEFMMGHVGSKDLQNYTCIGDGVNLASRLEGKNKEFHSWIVCSEDTYQHIADLVEAEYKGSEQVKGHAEPVNVYVIRGLKGAPRDEYWGGAPVEPAVAAPAAMNSSNRSPGGRTISSPPSHYSAGTQL